MATEKQRVTAIKNLTKGNKKAMASTRKKARAGEPTSSERGEWPTEKASSRKKTAKKKTGSKKTAARKKPAAKKSRAKKSTGKKKASGTRKKASKKR